LIPPCENFSSVFDYLLRGCEGELIVELKSAVLRAGPGGRYAAYPDCRSARGERHLRGLKDLALSGASVAVVFITTLYDVEAFTPYDEGDPLIRPLLRELLEAGGAVKAVSVRYFPEIGEILMWDPDLPTII
jgi:DNA-binding sugar fermentation-stimulating protein